MTHAQPSGALVGPPPASIIETEIKGDISLFDVRRDQVLVLNATASDVWRLCDGEQTLDEIVALLSKAYGRPAADIRTEVEATVARLIEEGFLPPL